MKKALSALVMTLLLISLNGCIIIGNSNNGNKPESDTCKDTQQASATENDTNTTLRNQSI